MSNVKPTKEAYEALQFAYDFFNKRLFDGALNGAMITLNRKGRSLGHFSPESFVNRRNVICDEINLNPAYFGSRPVEDVLSTLVHEQCHQWREYDGEPPRRAYHDKKWAGKMLEVGLQPSDSGSPGGKTVGEKMSHYILPDGAFIVACKDLLSQGEPIPWFDRYPEICRKDYSYAGTIVVPAKPINPGVLGGDGFSPPEAGNADGEDTVADGRLIEMPVFSPIPIENGLEVARPVSAVAGMVIGRSKSGTGGKPVDGSNRVKFSCGCGQNIWGKPGVRAICAECQGRFEPQH